METALLVLLMVVTAAAVAAAAVLGKKWLHTNHRLAGATAALEEAQAEVERTQKRLETAKRATDEARAEAARRLLATQSEVERHASDADVRGNQLEELQAENQRLKDELETRPRFDRAVYRIATLGVSGSGKTALSLKWANPLFELEMLAPTKAFDKYERTVSLTHRPGVTIEHVFEVNDWAGDRIEDAHDALVTEEIHGLLFVVDVGEKSLDEKRVARQLDEFQAPALRFIFGPKMLKSCRTAVLFINKSDFLPGMPAEVEQRAQACYQRLIDDLRVVQQKSNLELLVLVGSATSGHGTHRLFAHFVQHILPPTAYDEKLLQKMQNEELAQVVALPRR